MHRMKLTMALVSVVVLLLVNTPVRTVARDDVNWGHYGLTTEGTPEGSCKTSMVLWIEEVGDSGITKFRAHLELRALNDPGIPFMAYQTWGWQTSKAFGDDDQSYSVEFFPEITFPTGGRYKLVARFIAERPSFWQPDVKIFGEIEEIDEPIEVACETRVDAFG